MNTPDTEWREQLQEKTVWSSQCSNIKVLTLGVAERLIQEILTSRDTYWKERMGEESLPESFTIELLEDNYKKCCLAVNNTRIAGLKPTGFAKTVLTFRVNSKALLEALDTLLDNLK